jgi:hypothetical protein
MGKDSETRMITPILPQTNEPKEIQKALLDLASKILEAEKETIVELPATRTSPYTVPDGIGPVTILWTIGASTVDVKLGKTRNNLNRRVRVVKLGAGAGEIKVSPNGSELIGIWPYLYVGNQNQINDFSATMGVWIVKGQIQPVAGEPDIGGGYHEHYYNAGISATPTVGYYTIDLSGQTPLGVKLARVRVAHSGTADRYIAAYTDSTPTPTVSDIVARTSVTGIKMYSAGEVTLTSSRTFVYYANNTLAGADVIVYGYRLGPV